MSKIHRFPCPSCGKTLKVDDELLSHIRASGKGTHCPTCKAPVSVDIAPLLPPRLGAPPPLSAVHSFLVPTTLPPVAVLSPVETFPAEEGRAGPAPPKGRPRASFPKYFLPAFSVAASGLTLLYLVALLAFHAGRASVPAGDFFAPLPAVPRGWRPQTMTLEQFRDQIQADALQPGLERVRRQPRVNGRASKFL